MRLGQQQHELVQQEVRRAHRQGEQHAERGRSGTALYRQAESLLTGPNGDMPIMPIYWYTFSIPGRSRPCTATTKPNGPDRPHEGRHGLAPSHRHPNGQGAPAPARIAASPRIKLKLACSKFVVRRIVWTIPCSSWSSFMTFWMMRRSRAARSRSPNGRPAVDPANLDRKFDLDKPWWQQYMLLRRGHGHARPRAVARAAQPGRERHHQGALPGLAQARPVAMGFAIVVGIPLGIVRRPAANTLLDYTAHGLREPRLRDHRASSSRRCSSTSSRCG